MAGIYSLSVPATFRQSLNYLSAWELQAPTLATVGISELSLSTGTLGTSVAPSIGIFRTTTPGTAVGKWVLQPQDPADPPANSSVVTDWTKVPVLPTNPLRRITCEKAGMAWFFCFPKPLVVAAAGSVVLSAITIAAGSEITYNVDCMVVE